MNDKIPQTIRAVETLFSPDPIYLVGGSVRDLMLKREPKDFDFCTPLTPSEIKSRLYGRYRAFLTGERFGTIGFKINGQFVEVTTFRSESYTPGDRKPVVEFGKELFADLSRRDFTINAIAMRSKESPQGAQFQLTDPYDGRVDLKNELIRAVGQPTLRIKEDPLRMLRAVRFAGQLGFQIEEKLHRKIQEHAFRILTVPKERWMLELDKLLVSPHMLLGMNYLQTTGLLRFILPELQVQVDYNQNSRYHDHDLWTHSCLTVAEVPADLNLRWAAWLHDIGKPAARVNNKNGFANYVHHDRLGADMIPAIAHRLKWSAERRDTVQDLIKHHLEDDSPLRAADNSSKKAI